MLLLHKNVSHFMHEQTCTLGLYITERRRIASALFMGLTRVDDIVV